MAIRGCRSAGETRSYLTVRNARYVNDGAYKVVVRNTLGSSTSAPAILTVVEPPLNAGAPDVGFYAGLGPNDRVNAVAVQTDGKIVIGGAFTEVDGTSRNRLARLNRDGSHDIGFNPQWGADAIVSALAVQADGKVLVGGNVSGTTTGRVRRLNPNGTEDPAFNVAVVGGPLPVRAILVQSDGAVLIGGDFSVLDGSPRFGLDPLRGRRDVGCGFHIPFPSFLPANFVAAIARQTDGAIFAGGSFYLPTTVAGAIQREIARLQSNGAHDATFDCLPAGRFVNAIAIEPDGQVLIASEWPVGNLAAPNVTRLNSDGSRDAGFAPGVNNSVRALALQPDGTIVAGGNFSAVNAAPAPCLVRLKSDGTTDSSFNVGEGIVGGTPIIDEYGEYGEITREATVLAMAIEGPNSAIVAGNFTTVNGAARPYVARVFLRDFSNVDTDADGLPDWWEQQYGLDASSAAGVNGGAGDYDGDVRTNRTEYINGTNPVRGESVEPLLVITEISPGVRELSFDTLRGRIYRIHFSPGSRAAFHPHQHDVRRNRCGSGLDRRRNPHRRPGAEAVLQAAGRTRSDAVIGRVLSPAGQFGEEVLEGAGRRVERREDTDLVEAGALLAIYPPHQ